MKWTTIVKEDCCKVANYTRSNDKFWVCYLWKMICWPTRHKSKQRQKCMLNAWIQTEKENITWWSKQMTNALIYMRLVSEVLRSEPKQRDQKTSNSADTIIRNDKRKGTTTMADEQLRIFKWWWGMEMCLIIWIETRRIKFQRASCDKCERIGPVWHGCHHCREDKQGVTSQEYGDYYQESNRSDYVCDTKTAQNSKTKL